LLLTASNANSWTIILCAHTPSVRRFHFFLLPIRTQSTMTAPDTLPEPEQGMDSIVVTPSSPFLISMKAPPGFYSFFFLTPRPASVPRYARATPFIPLAF